MSQLSLKNVTLSLTDKRTDEAIEFHIMRAGTRFYFTSMKTRNPLTPVHTLEGETNGFRMGSCPPVQ